MEVIACGVNEEREKVYLHGHACDYVNHEMVLLHAACDK
jgi:hypothetical protein